MVKNILIVLLMILLSGCGQVMPQKVVIVIDQKSTNNVHNLCFHTTSDKQCLSSLQLNTENILELSVSRDTSVFISYDIKNKPVYINEDLGCYFDRAMIKLSQKKGFVKVLIKDNIVYKVDGTIAYHENIKKYKFEKYNTLLTRHNGLKYLKK